MNIIIYEPEKWKTMKKVFLLGMMLCLLFFSCRQMPNESDAVELNQKGIDYMNEGNYEQALKEFTQAISNNQLDKVSKGTIYRNIALTYSELGKTDSSIHFYTIAAKLYPRNSYDYLVNMAGVDLLTNKTANGLSRLLKASALDPEDLSVNNSLGLIYLGDYGEEFTDPEKALPYNKKANQISSSRITEDILGRNYYDLKDYATAEMYYEKIHNQYPEIVSYALSTGMIKYKLKKIAEAELLFKKVLAKDSSYKETIEVFKDNNKLE